MSVLDDVPVATPTFIASLVVIVIAYISNDLSLDNVFEALALAGVGSFGIGHVRNGAGKGLRK